MDKLRLSSTHDWLTKQEQITLAILGVLALVAFGILAWQQKTVASAIGELYVSSETHQWDHALKVARKIDVNRASVAELKRLPGIGPKLAQRIISYRSKQGYFSDVEMLLKIKGIGNATLAALEEYIKVE